MSDPSAYMSPEVSNISITSRRAEVEASIIQVTCILHTIMYDKLNFNRVLFVFSMGGHGALVCFLRNPGKYASVSAFAPICNPSECPWGQKAFGGYLGSSRDQWKVWLMSSNCTSNTCCHLHYNQC